MQNVLPLSNRFWHDRQCEETPLLLLLRTNGELFQPCGVHIFSINDCSERLRSVFVPRGDPISLVSLKLSGVFEAKKSGSYSSMADIFELSLELMREPRKDGAQFVMHENSCVTSERRHINLSERWRQLFPKLELPWFSRYVCLHRFVFYKSI